MKIHVSLHILLFLFLLSSCTDNSGNKTKAENSSPQKKEWAIVLHGGAGNMNAKRMSPEAQDGYKQSLSAALTLGENILKEGGTSMDAIEAVIVQLENDSLFNAGKGAVLTYEGHAELDASFMDGATLNCGSVTGIQNIKNPIKAARMVMDSSEHVFFSGPGATSFALEYGLEWVDSTYFTTHRRMNSYLNRKKEMAVSSSMDFEKFGTVGCVALDNSGHLAAGTSTGGMSMKRHGRIGDSPIIGAGTYANDETCGISCTGWGEYFIRAAVAHDVHARMAYGESSLDESSVEVIQHVVPDLGGNGGLIGIDKNGDIVMEFNTTGMFRASSDSEGQRTVAIFK